MFQEVSNLKILHSAGARVPQVLDDNTSEYENLETPLFFVMDYVSGQTLAQLVSQENRLNLAKAVELTLQLCKTFGIAFRERISHRDIKPENLMVTYGEASEIVVVDFGLSFNEDSAQTLTDVDEAFDNKFISLPERRGPGENKRDPRSDITGLCAVLFFCLTGCAPRNLRDSKNRPPHRWDNFLMTSIGLPAKQAEALNALFDRGFQHELQSRFQTLAEFESRVLELLSEISTPLLEDLSIIAQRESAVLRGTDRRTLLAGLRNSSTPLSAALRKKLTEIKVKLDGTLFKITAATSFRPFPKEEGDEVFLTTYDVGVNNHQTRIGIQFIVACKNSECVLLRRSYDWIGTKTDNPQTNMLMRYDARLGNPDISLMTADFEAAVAAAIQRLRTLIQEPPK